MSYLILIIVGCIAGLFSSLFGLGGGLTIVPALVYVLPIFGFSLADVTHVAIGTTLSIMIFNSANSLRSYCRRSTLDSHLVYKLIPFLIIGTLVGAVIAYHIPGRYLILAYVIFIVSVIVKCIKRLLAERHEEHAEPERSFHLPALRRSLYGMFTGLVSACTGGGSSLVMVPVLNHAGLAIQRAAGVANGLNIVIAIIASISYGYLGSHALAAAPHYTTGFIYWPAFALIIIGSFIGVPIGSVIGYKLSERLAERIFLVFVIVIFFIMSFKVYQMFQSALS